ncbi:MAG: molecular chaperone HtpG [Bacteroidales bacterium]|jgi:molecular chaperone HtpG|nr:molecular chaperone HtpG [Bacteroidales bacterium]MDD2570293.1 molecular chaperone HtpG [Bacteroidales bacterium]MDD2811976.1 molecular chaperone HtpG [Bacteroidales bacterium]MDD3385357.1 molecular chaperone HtpG [Bacteroidales bacterium]MDD3811516.1 molecular chaperone HtpG [Bacteroidales bacterium]
METTKQQGTINVTSENIFPIIKKFLYSDHEIFLRELVSNAVDATQKLKTLASVGEFKGELGDLTIRVSIDPKKKTLTVSDRGIGMTAKEIDKYINQIAFSGAEEFMKKYKKDANAIIGHFGLGFYSSFMVSDKVEIVTKSHKRGKAVRWSCKGTTDYTIEEVDREDRGTDIILHLDKESDEFLKEERINEILKKYSKFLPVPIAFGKKKEWKDGKQVETDEDLIINNTEPAWTKKPADLKEEDYAAFYREIYPMSEDPLFHIHLNVDYPFNLTGILYFPKIRNNWEVQKNKIQLYANQVFVTDSVEGIVPDFLTLLHGVIDSPDIPLNVSRSYLQSDQNVKKISAHITKKVADRLKEIFTSDREQFESKWDDLKLFINYGMLTEEKFYDKAKDFALLKNVDGKYFTYDEYKKLIKENQTDQEKNLIYLYASDKEEQFSYIQAARDKGYDVLLMDGQFDTHFLNHLETKFESSHFIRVDSDVVDKLIKKEQTLESKLDKTLEGWLQPVFKSQLPGEGYYVTFEALDETQLPIMITQSEWSRRMKEMSKLTNGMNFYKDLPDSYNLVVNSNHPLILSLAGELKDSKGETAARFEEEMKQIKSDQESLEQLLKDKKYDELTQEEKDKREELTKLLDEKTAERDAALQAFAGEQPVVSQLIDLALLATNKLTGESLDRFVKRSVSLLGKQ